nr:hypothetical protein [Kofleriaceae bacterium]
MTAARALVLVLVTVVAAPARADDVEVRIPDKLVVAAGEPGTLNVAIAVDHGHAISRDAALIIDLAPDAALHVKKRRLGRADAVDPEADAPRFAIAVRADTAGSASIGVRVRFWLCTAHACKPVDLKRNVAVEIDAGSGSGSGSGS